MSAFVNAQVLYSELLCLMQHLYDQEGSDKDYLRLIASKVQRAEFVNFTELLSNEEYEGLIAEQTTPELLAPSLFKYFDDVNNQPVVFAVGKANDYRAILVNRHGSEIEVLLVERIPEGGSLFNGMLFFNGEKWGIQSPCITKDSPNGGPDLPGIFKFLFCQLRILAVVLAQDKPKKMCFSTVMDLSAHEHWPLLPQPPWVAVMAQVAAELAAESPAA